MLLGIARTADLAGWGTQNQTSGLAISVPVTANFSGAYVPGYYYQDFSGITTTTQSTVSSEWNTWDGTGSAAFDQSSLTNSPKLMVKAVTFKLGSGWGNYTTWNAGRVNAHYSKWTDSVGTNIGVGAFVINPGSATGSLNFNGSLWERGVTATVISTTVSNIQNNYLDRWLAFVSATSDTTSTFANWTGGSLTARNWCERSILVDIATQTIIGQADAVALATGGFDNSQNFSTQAYAIDSGSYQFQSQGIIQDSGSYSSTFNATPYYKLSDWVTVGNTFDPIDYWQQITGETPLPVVNGYTAWFVTNSDSAGTSTTFSGSPAYRISVSASTRQPAGVYQYIANPYGTTPAPVYTSYTG
jgi:hypothetical protein